MLAMPAQNMLVNFRNEFIVCPQNALRIAHAADRRVDSSSFCFPSAQMRLLLRCKQTSTTLRKSLTSPFNQLIYNDPQCTALAIECPSVWTLGSRLTARTPDSANQVGENQWRILRRGTKNFRSAILFCQSSHTKGEVGAAVGSLSGT